MTAAHAAWMPMYVGDYLKDTQHLSTAEHGAYILLIIHAWTREGALPADTERLRRITGMDQKDWKRSWPVLREFFQEDGDGYRHSRIDRELANARRMVEQRSAAGKASAEARRRQRSLNDDGNENPTVVERDDQRNGRPSQSPNAIDKSIAGRKNGSRLPPDFEMPDDWLQWAMAERHWDAVDAQAEAASFIDYWHAKPGREAAKLDWHATWRNWVRNSRRVGVVATKEPFQI